MLPFRLAEVRYPGWYCTHRQNENSILMQVFFITGLDYPLKLELTRNSTRQALLTCVFNDSSWLTISKSCSHRVSKIYGHTGLVSSGTLLNSFISLPFRGVLFFFLISRRIGGLYRGLRSWRFNTMQCVLICHPHYSSGGINLSSFTWRTLCFFNPICSDAHGYFQLFFVIWFLTRTFT